MDVSIIIVNYNTLDLTKNCIESVIKKTNDLMYEIILVDNNSTDGSVEFFTNYQRDNFIFIPLKHNIGFGRANNRGIEKSRGKYIFFLNSDTLIVNNAIKVLFDTMEKNTNIGVCGGNLYHHDMTPNNSYFDRLPDLKTEFNQAWGIYFSKFLKHKTNFNYTDRVAKVGYVIGADMMIPQRILNEVGVFDEDFFMYYEESELTFRIHKQHYEIVCNPNAKIVHLDGGSSKSSYNKLKMTLESKYKYFYKVYGYRNMRYCFWIFQTSFCLRYFLTLNKKYKKIIDLNKNIYRKYKILIKSEGL